MKNVFRAEQVQVLETINGSFLFSLQNGSEGGGLLSYQAKGKLPFG